MNMNFLVVRGAKQNWLEVPIEFVRAVGIISDLSSSSYIKEEMAFLEEDCDAPLFLQELEKRNIYYSLDEVYEDNDE